MLKNTLLKSPIQKKLNLKQNFNFFNLKNIQAGNQTINILKQQQKQYFASEKQNEVDEDEEPDIYTRSRVQEFKKLYEIKNKRIPGYATKEGTEKYTTRNKGVSKVHFKSPFDTDLKLSSIGMTTFEVTYDEQTDKMICFNSIIDAVQSGGCNVLDTSNNSMGMSGERVTGAAIRYLQESQNIQRDELFISTKHGKITEDTDQGISGNKLIMKLVKDKVLQDKDFSERKCYHPEFLKYQFESSLNNIGLECLDLVYLNDPNDNLKDNDLYYDKIARAFEFYESRIQEGQLRFYGIDSWEGFRSSHKEEFVHLKLQKLQEIAIKVGGPENKFKFIQFPMNIIMNEALTDKFQQYNPNLIVDINGKTLNNNQNNNENTTTENVEQEQQQEQKVEEQENTNKENPDKIEYMTIFQLANKLNINIISKSVLDSGNALSQKIKDSLISLDSHIARHVQLSRSTPSQSYICSILEPDEEDEIRENISVLGADPLPEDEVLRIYKKLKIKVKDLN